MPLPGEPSLAYPPRHAPAFLPSSWALTSGSRSDLSLSCPWIRGTYCVNAASPYSSIDYELLFQKPCHTLSVSPTREGAGMPYFSSPGHTIDPFTATVWAWAKESFSLISTHIFRAEHIPHKNYQDLCFLTMILISFLWVSKPTVRHLCYLTTLEDRRLCESYQPQVDLFFYVSASTKIKREDAIWRPKLLQCWLVRS